MVNGKKNRWKTDASSFIKRTMYEFLEFARASIFGFWVAVTGILFLFDQTLAWASLATKEWLEKTTPKKRRPLELWAIAIAMLWGCFNAWEGERQKIANLQRNLDNYLRSDLVFSREATIESANSSELGDYKNVNIEVQSKIGTSLNERAYIVSLHSLDNKNLLFNNRVLTAFHLGEDSFYPQSIDIYGQKVIPLIIKRGNSLSIFDKVSSDNTCGWCYNIPNGRYELIIIVQNDKNSSPAKYLVDWRGDRGLNVSLR